MRRLLALSVLAVTPFLATAPAHAEGGLCARVSQNGTTVPHFDSGEFCTMGILQHNWGYCLWDEPGVSPDVEFRIDVCWPMP
jgi:hypothetical protein